MDLATLRWVSDTTQLKETIGVMQQVRAAVSTLETAQTKAATSSAKADKAAADAAKAQAQAALAAIKLEKEKQKAVQESSDATVAAGNRSISVLEKQEQVLNFMVQGYSRGQSSILATAKAAGAATDELERLGSTLQSQRTLMGSDPFDKSLGALRALKNEFSVVKEQVRLYNAELGLTRKQSEDLARDKLRLIEASKIEGKSIFSIRDAVKDLNAEYIRLAKAENDLVGSYKNNVKTASDAAKANTYLETELQKVRFAVDEQNAALNRGSANALVRFENALKKSGKTAAEQKILLDEYRKSMEKLQSAGASRATDYISRAVGPQLTDIIVGLSTGQSLMTVMMQQGGQLRDQFAMMGVAGAEMGAVMRTALSSMAVSVKDTAVAFGQLFVGGVMDAGKAILNFGTAITGLDVVLDASKKKLIAMGDDGARGLSVLTRIGSVMATVVGAGAIGGVAALGGLLVALKQVIQEEDALARQLALTGGSLALSHNAALEYASSLRDVAGSTSKAMDVIATMAKQGGFAATEISLVTKAATDMFKYGGVAIEDTVKAFAKMKEKPVESLIELAKQTGLVTIETIAVVNQLMEQGRTAEATAIALKTLGDVNSQQAARMKEDYSDFANFIIDWSSSISNAVSGVFKDIWRKASPQQQLKDQVAAIDDMLEGRASLAGWLATATESQRTSLILQKQELQNQLALMDVQEKMASDAQKENVEKADNFKKLDALMKGVNQTISKAADKTLTLSEFTKKYREEKTKGLEVDNQQLALIEKAAEIEWKAMQKKPSTTGENYFANLLRSVTTESINAEAAQDKLTKAYTKMLELASDSRFLKLSETQKAMVMEKLNEAHNTELLTQRTKDLADAEELRNKILGKVDGQGKEYYSTIEKLNSAVKSGAMGQEEATELAKSLGQATPFAKAMSEWFARGREALSKYTDEFKKFSAESQMQNQELDLQFALLGKSSDEQKKMTIEAQKQIKLQKALNDYERERLKILNDQNLVTDDAKNQAMLLNDQKYAEQVRLINRETAYQYAADIQQQFNEIRDGISGSIVEALFNGGKSGAQKLRSLLIEQLKKPVTLVVNAVVNTLLGSVIGGLVGGSGGSAGSLMSTAGGIGNLLGGLGSFGSTIAGGIGSAVGSIFGVGAGNVALGTSLGLGASSSTAAALAAAQAGGAAGGAGAAGMGSFLSSAGAAMPYIGAAVALISLISGLDDSGTYHTGGASRYSRSGGLTSGNSAAAFGIGFGQVETGKDTISAMETLSKSLVEIFDGIAKTFGKTAGYEVAVAFADDTSKDGAWGAFGVRLQGVEILNWDDFRQSKWAPKEFGDGEEGYKQYLAAIAKDTRQVILDMDLPSWADQVLNDIGDAPSLESLSKAIQELAQMKSLYDLMTSQMVNFANITDDSFGKLIKEFGDIGTMANQVAGYYQNYYTEFERFNKAQADVAKSFADIGLSMPANRDEFRKLAESQDLNTEAGRKMYAQLMALAASFNVVIDATEQLANARTDIMYRMMEQEAALLDAQGRTAEADKKRRELLDKQRGAEYERLMKINPELARLTAELWALEDAAVATANAAARAREIADTRQDLTDRILQQEAQLLDSQGRTAEADRKRRELLDRQRARENERLMALNPELARLAYELWLLEDATAAAAQATALRNKKINESYSQLQKAVEAEKKVLNERIATSQGLISTLTAIFDTVSGAVKELYNQVDSTAAMSFQSAKSYISGVFNSVMQGGGIGDSKLLTTAVEDAMAGLNASNYRTKAEYDRERLRLAGQLALIGDTAEESLTNEQRVLKGLEDQIDKLDETLAYWKDMIDIANGTYVATVSVTQAVNQLTELIRTVTSPEGTGEKPMPKPVGTETGTGGGGSGGTPVFGGGGSGGGSSGIKYDSNGNIIYADGSIGYRNWYRDISGALHWGYVSKEAWEQEYARGTPGYGNPPAFANGGNYKGGLALVGEEGPELINFNQGGYVHTAAQTAAMLSGGSSMESRIASLERAAVNTASALTQIATNTKRTADVLRNISPNGDSIQVESESFLEI